MILLLETATLNCSVALATEDGLCIAHRDEAGQSHRHAERLHMLIDEVLQTAGASRSDLTAVAIGKGPGSFTGLRIGTSAAKGICTGLGIPLVAPSPLSALRHRGALLRPELVSTPNRIFPAIDARRMEIFTLDKQGQPTAAIVDAGFMNDLGTGPALLIGDGAEKCGDVLKPSTTNWEVLAAYPSAQDMVPETLQLLMQSRTEDVAEFEPFYLKDFIPGKPKDPLGLHNPTP
ncbi:MAG: tRNA (adenosine(37)-N6)-threonylcarbamoyltransferase complex dimerization subunit type 1 TsaB [Crocinitomicaceae bacterium]|nr:tRNA (adenosine(37)-N6)-threonylcarbamoyltransferase complex dimerization subunit type 1 TsaB [Crocinitomicaceae bacterium]